jgi:muconolactone delta-isomerase
MEFLVEFQVIVPDGTPEGEVKARERAEASAAARLVNDGHLVRVWKRPVPNAESTILGLYRADSQAQLDGLLCALPLHEWMHVIVTPLEAHPNDPGPRAAAE